MADAENGPAHHLATQGGGMNYRAHVGHRQEVQDAVLAGFDIHFHFRERGDEGMGVAVVRELVLGHRQQPLAGEIGGGGLGELVDVGGHFVAVVLAAELDGLLRRARYNGKTVGSMGHFGAFSFFPSKNLTVLGDGGCLVTNDDALADKVRALRNHGRKDKYHHDFAGFNVRFNEIQGAIGRVMLNHLDGFNDNRRNIAAHYNERLKGIVPTPVEKPWARAVYHMYVIRSEKRDALQKFLGERNIGTGIHYPVPNHQQPGVTNRFQNMPRLPKTEQAVKEILSLPIHGEMTLDTADKVCDAIAEFYGKR